jgi:hypothetical protein
MRYIVVTLLNLENASIAVAFPFPNCCNLVGVPGVGGDGSLQRVPGQEDIAVPHQSSPGTNVKELFRH